jgi:VWFA-related protein
VYSVLTPMHVVRRLQRLSALVLFLPTVGVTQINPSNSTAPSASTIQILINASDKYGNTVSLSRSSLEVYVDKKLIQIEELKPAAGAPLRFVLLLDLSGSNIDKLKFEKKAAAQIFEALSKGNNEGYFGWFNQRVAISAHPMQLSEVNQFLRNANTGGGTALYDAIAQASEQQLHRSSGSSSVRRVLFVITDGEDNQSHIAASDAAKTAQREGVPVFSLCLLSSSPRATGGAVVKKLAHDTGGNAVVLDSPKEFLGKLLQPLVTQYFLIFAPPPSKQNLTRLEIKSSDHSIEIAAPSGYSTD